MKQVIEKLNVITWQPPTRKGAFADIQVAPDQLQDFLAEMQGHELTTMHDDLGKSIREEGAYKIYASTSASLSNGGEEITHDRYRCPGLVRTPHEPNFIDLHA
jgi:hypothetical protein